MFIRSGKYEFNWIGLSENEHLLYTFNEMYTKIVIILVNRPEILSDHINLKDKPTFDHE